MHIILAPSAIILAAERLSSIANNAGPLFARAWLALAYLGTLPMRDARDALAHLSYRSCSTQMQGRHSNSCLQQLTTMEIDCFNLQVMREGLDEHLDGPWAMVLEEEQRKKRRET